MTWYINTSTQLKQWHLHFTDLFSIKRLSSVLKEWNIQRFLSFFCSQPNRTNILTLRKLLPKHWKIKLTFLLGFSERKSMEYNLMYALDKQKYEFWLKHSKEVIDKHHSQNSYVTVSLTETVRT